MRIHAFIFLLLSGVSISNVIAQQSSEPPRTCATMEQDSLNKILYPRRSTLDDFEESIQQKMREIQIRTKSSGRTQALLMTIPIIVHVVHNGEPIGSGMNLSKAQIQAQIDVLNEDF